MYIKIHRVVNHQTIEIYVFTNTNDKQQDFFSRDELDDIAANKIPIHYSSITINADDTILVLKLKLFATIQEHHPHLLSTIYEMYMFYHTPTVFNIQSTYQLLTHDDKFLLYSSNFTQFMKNYVNMKLSHSLRKKIYTKNDIVKLYNKDYSEPTLTTFVLGETDYETSHCKPFIRNPYDVDANYSKQSIYECDNSILSFDGKMLVDIPNISGQTIYLCLAQDTLSSNMEEKKIRYLIEYFYPMLHEYNVDLTTLNRLPTKLLEYHAMYASDDMYRIFHNIQLFNTIQLDDDNNHSDVHGVTFIKCTIPDKSHTSFPVDEVFKVLHSTKQYPFIRYINNYKKKEYIYRLCSNGISISGKKIPMLTYVEYTRMHKTLDNTKALSIYLLHSSDISYNVLVEIAETGDVSISCDSSQHPTTLQTIDGVLGECLPPLFEQLQFILSAFNYTIEPFRSLYERTIIINNIHYSRIIPTNKKLNYQPIYPYIRDVFVDHSQITQTIDANLLRFYFTRISDYSKEESIKLYIISQFKKNIPPNTILANVMNSFSMISRDDIREIMQAETTDLENKYMRNIVISTPHTGCVIDIKNDPLNQQTVISIDNVHTLRGLDIITNYVDKLFYLSAMDNNVEYCKTYQSTYNPPAFLQTQTQIHEIVENKIDSDIDIDSENESESENDIGKAWDSDDEPLPPIAAVYDDNSDQESVSSFLSDKKDKDDDDEFIDDADNTPAVKVDDAVEIESDDTFKSDDTPAVKVDESDDTFKSDNVVKNMDDVDDAASVNTFVSEDDEDEDASDDDDKINGGGVTSSAEIVGAKLKNPFIFQAKIEALDAPLILKKEQDGFNNYVRVCKKDRQPVIVTDEELSEIKKTTTLNDGDVISYGSNPDKKYNYMCPQYWCLLTNKPISPSELKTNSDGELYHPTCGKVIPPNESKVRAGYYIYDFTKTTDRKLMERFPGLITGKHPDGFCLPCCFAKKFKMDQAKNCDKNAKQQPQPAAKSNNPDPQSQRIEAENQYIVNHGKKLDNERWGNVIPELNEFMGIQNDTSFKFLRRGCQQSANQSFIGCIANALWYGEPNSSIPTIDEFKQTIIQSITLDDFITLQNGNLVIDFCQPNYDNIATEIPPIHADTQFVKLIDRTDPLQLSYFKKTISAFNHFTSFFMDSESVIDHTYLWDIVSKPNPLLFKLGVNLVIFDVKTMTDLEKHAYNVIQIVCPTNYSSTPYRDNIPFLFINKTSNIYEPIYLVERTPIGDKTITKLIDTKEDTTIPRQFAETIENELVPIINANCKPFVNTSIRTPRPMRINKLAPLLTSISFAIRYFVLNYNNKVIGVIVNKLATEDVQVFIPCFATGIPILSENTIHRYLFVSDVAKHTTTLTNTLNTYKFIQRHSNIFPAINKLIVSDNNRVIGMLTDSQQFVYIHKQENVPALAKLTKYKLTVEPNIGYDSIDSGWILPTNKQYMSEMDEITNIQQESNFYNLFKNSVRIHLNSSPNIQLKINTDKIVSSNQLSYIEKINQFVVLFKQLMTTIHFTDDKSKYEQSLVSTGNCMTTDCELYLPRYNLHTQLDNQIVYPTRLADDFIRNSLVHDFMINTDEYYIHSYIQFQVNQHELVLTSQTIEDYYKNLVYTQLASQISNISHDESFYNGAQQFTTTVPLINYKMPPIISSPKEPVFFEEPNASSESVEEQPRQEISHTLKHVSEPKIAAAASLEHHRREISQIEHVSEPKMAAVSLESVKERPKLGNNPNQSCKKGYERNPSTGRCIKSCSKNMVRSEKTNRCVKKPITVIESSDSSDEKKKPSPPHVKPKPIPIKKKVVVYSSDSDDDIIIKPDAIILDCKEGYERSRTTGRCIKACPSGMTRNTKTNRCIKKKKPLKVIESDSDDDVPIVDVIDNKIYPDSDGDITF